MPTPDETLATKALTALEIKDAEKGEVEAIVATLGVVDRDYDVIQEGAIMDGAKVKLSGYGHDTVFSGAMPVGRGAIHIDGDKAVFRGKVFMSTARGRETLAVLKEMGAEQEWSFGFRVIGREEPDEAWSKRGARRILTKLEAFEVSPVLIGAGIDTQTVRAKEADDAAARADAEAATARQEAEAKAAAEAVAQRDRTAVAMEEYHRVQRALRRMGVA